MWPECEFGNTSMPLFCIEFKMTLTITNQKWDGATHPPWNFQHGTTAYFPDATAAYPHRGYSYDTEQVLPYVT